jgi:hypothetical protein
MTTQQVTKIDNINKRLLSLPMEERQYAASTTCFGLVSKVAIEDSHPKAKKPSRSTKE